MDTREPPLKDIPIGYDASFLRDIADMVKNKTLFFIPFFGAYLAFLFGKTDYIKHANFVIWIILIAIFVMSVRYISLVSDLLWAVETSRIILKVRTMENTEWPNWEKDHAALVSVMRIIPKLVQAENWWYRKLMLTMYTASFVVLIDLFVGDWPLTLVHRFWPQFLPN